MLRRIKYAVLGGVMLAGIAACDSSWARQKSVDSDDETGASAEAVVEPGDIGKPLYEPKNLPAPNPDAGKLPGVAVDPVVMPCHLTVVDKEEVPSLRDGAIHFIGTDVKPGEWEILPPELRVEVAIDGKTRQYRRLRQGDFVEKDQLMGMLDDRLARADKGVKDAKVEVAQADLDASQKTANEAMARYNTQQRLWNSDRGRVTSEEELRGALLLWQKSGFDSKSKEATLKEARLEAKSSQTVLDLHEIRASIPGVIKFVYKTSGEAVRANEGVFQLTDLSRLRADGLLDRQQVSKLQDPLKIVIEPSEPQSPQQTLIGHLQEVNAVAVTKDTANPAIVSASEDGTVRVWDRNTRRDRKILRNARQVPVRAVACTSPGSKANLSLSGSQDGSGRIWDLDANSDEPLRELADRHHGAVTCVAFSPDGETCVTGGEDHQIRLWETATGKLRYRFPAGHHGTVTSLQFTPQSQLVSAGRDNAIRVWNLGENGAKQEVVFDRRTGEVGQIGVSPDGRSVLFDQGKSLRLLAIPGGSTQGVLYNPTASSGFSAFALFSPDGRLIVTAGAAEGQLQLWRAPSAATNNRGYEVRQLTLNQRSTVPTCACFSADGTLLITGTREGLVQAWSIPAQKEIEHELAGKLTLVEKSVESTAGQVRVWADVPNADGRLLPGGAATLTVYPRR